MTNNRDSKKSPVDQIKSNNEKGARASLLEELFYDFNRSRAQVYWMNFVRGLFFAAGTVIGGTIVIALLVWIFSLLGNIIPPLGDFFEGLSRAINAGKSK